MEYGPADLDKKVHGIRVRMRAVPVWRCRSCGQTQLTLPVARYLSAFLRCLLKELPPPPAELEHPLVPIEIVFSPK